MGLLVLIRLCKKLGLINQLPLLKKVYGKERDADTPNIQRNLIENCSNQLLFLIFNSITSSLIVMS